MAKSKGTPGKLASNNTFEDGLMADMHPMSTPASALSDAMNMEFVTTSGDQYVLQNIKGSELEASLPSGFFPLAVREYRNIAYIIAGSFGEDGEFKKGLIGTYPSPDWERLAIGKEQNVDCTHTVEVQGTSYREENSTDAPDIVLTTDVTGTYKEGTAIIFIVPAGAGARLVLKPVYIPAPMADLVISYDYASLFGPAVNAQQFDNYGVGYDYILTDVISEITIDMPLSSDARYSNTTLEFNLSGRRVSTGTFSLYYGNKVFNIAMVLNHDKTPNTSHVYKVELESFVPKAPVTLIYKRKMSDYYMNEVLRSQSGVLSTNAEFNAFYDMAKLEELVGSGAAAAIHKPLPADMDGSYYQQFMAVMFADGSMGCTLSAKEWFVKNYDYMSTAKKLEIETYLKGDLEINSITAKAFTTTTSNTTVLEDIFRPIGNFGPNGSGDFISGSFKFDKTSFVDLKVTGSYDGSADLIFTDDKNDVMLVNSRFKVDESNVVRLADRIGINDSNIYSEKTWDKTKLLQDSVGIATVVGPSLDDNGKLLGGGYRYYMKYTTQEGNMSDIFYESPFIPIAQEKFGIRGDEYSSRDITFELSALNKAYGEIKVYFEHHTGDNGVIIKTYEIEQTYKIDKFSRSTVIHTGFEPTKAVDPTAINAIITPIDKVKTLEIVNDRLILANAVSTYNEDDDDTLAAVSSGLHMEQAETPIDGTYADPENVIDYLGYWKGEPYEFGIVYILRKGGTSSVYPIKGVDYDTETDITNTLGLYRLPHEGRIYDIVESSNGSGPTSRIKRPIVSHFKFIADDIRVNQKVLDIAEGYFIVRRERVKNALMQGILSPIAKIPTSNRGMGYSKENGDYYLDRRNTRTYVSQDEDTDIWYYYYLMGYLEETGQALVDAVDYSTGYTNTTFDPLPEPYTEEKLNEAVDRVVIDSSYYIRVAYIDPGVKAEVRAFEDAAGDSGEYLGAGDGLTFAPSNDTIDGILKPLFKYVPQPTQYLELVDYAGALSAANRAYCNDTDSKEAAAFYSGDLETDAANMATKVVGGIGSMIIHANSDEFARPANIFRDIMDVDLSVGYKKCQQVYNDCMEAAKNRYDDTEGCCFTGKRGHLKEDKKKCKSAKSDCRNRLQNTDEDSLGGVTSKILIEACNATVLGNAPISYTNMDMMFVPSGVNVEADKVFSGMSDRDLGYPMAVTESGVTFYERRYEAQETVAKLRNESVYGKYFAPAAEWFQKYSTYVGVKASEEIDFKYTSGVTKVLKDYGLKTEIETFVRVDNKAKNWVGSMGDVTTLYVSPTGKWTNEDLLTIFSNRNSRPYFAVSDRMPILSENFDVFRGDGYITRTYKRLSYKAGVGEPVARQSDAYVYGVGVYYGLTYDSKDTTNHIDDVMHIYQKDDLGMGLYDIGEIIELISYTNTNADLRSLERVSASDSMDGGGDRSFYPNDEASKLRGDLRPDSAAYNHGYTGHMGVLPYFSRADVPVNELEFPNRVYASAPNISQNFYNSFKDLRGFSYRDYGVELGSITKVVAIGGMLVSVHKDGVLGIGVDDRSLMAENSDVFIDSAKVLSPKPMEISKVLGSQHSESIVMIGDTFMGVDYARSTIWLFGGQKLTNVSEFTIKTIIEEFKGKITGTPKVFGTFNSTKHEAIFTFVNVDADNVQTTVGALIYSTLMKRWTSRRDDGLKFMVQLNSAALSFGIKKPSELWREDVNEERCVFRGEQHEYYWEAVVNDTPQAEKILDNIQLISNKNIPVDITYTLSGDASDAAVLFAGDKASEKVIVQKIVTRGLNGGRLGIVNQNAYYKNSGVFIEVSKTGSGSKKLDNKRRIRDKYIKIKIRYSGSDAVFIQAMLTKLSISYG